MSEAMSVQTAPAPAVSDFDHAYKLGMLSGEVRLLKWAVAAAFVAILGGMGVLYDAIENVRVELVEMRKDISGLRTDMTGVQKDVTAIDARVVVIEEKVVTIEEDVAELKTDMADLKTDVADLKTMHSSSMEDVQGRLGTSRALPSHVDPTGEPAPPASTIPPA